MKESVYNMYVSQLEIALANPTCWECLKFDPLQRSGFFCDDRGKVVVKTSSIKNYCFSPVELEEFSRRRAIIEDNNKRYRANYKITHRDHMLEYRKKYYRSHRAECLKYSKEYSAQKRMARNTV